MRRNEQPHCYNPESHYQMSCHKIKIKKRERGEAHLYKWVKSLYFPTLQIFNVLLACYIFVIVLKGKQNKQGKGILVCKYMTSQQNYHFGFYKCVI